MGLHIKYFGMLAEIAGQSEEVWLQDQGLTVGKFRQQILDKYPAMREKKFKVAVNQKIAGDLEPIDSQAEIALLPPFAGG